MSIKIKHFLMNLLILHEMTELGRLQGPTSPILFMNMIQNKILEFMDPDPDLKTTNIDSSVPCAIVKMFENVLFFPTKYVHDCLELFCKHTT